MPFKVLFDTWGGGRISLPPVAGTPATGQELAPVVKTLPRKSTMILSTAPLPGGAAWSSQWIDTAGTGDIYVTLSLACQGSVNGVLQLQESDDPSNALQLIAAVNSITYTLGGTGNVVGGQVRKRYWRANINTGTLTIVQLTATVSSFGSTAILGQGVANSTFNQVPVSITSSQAVTDAAQILGIWQANATSQPLAVGTWALTGVPGAANAVGVRTPNIFRGAQFSGTGANIIWTPPSTKKVRLMKYKIEVGEDATITSGPLPINLQFGQQLGTTNGPAMPYASCTPFTHRLVIPAAVLATSFDGYDSGWVDLGNGVLLATAGRALTMGIQVPQSTAAITSPAWAIASNQWEAATVGFKTNSNLGNFKLVQQNSLGVVASSATLSAVQTLTGSSVFVFFRTTNPVGGAPTVTVTDTAGNTYTTGTLVTNASDSANGSSLGVAYCINAVGNAANVVVVTTSVNLATVVFGAYLEYHGTSSGGGIDAAQVGATGNSTAPASGNYTPSTAGDLVFTFMGTAATLASQPTVPTAFTLRHASFSASGALAVADNFGNGSLAAGQINVVCCGTEE